MSLRAVVYLSCVGLMLGSHGGRAEESETSSKADPSAGERLQLAREIYQELAGLIVQELTEPPDPMLNEQGGYASILSAGRADEFYDWSRRWMEAERDASPEESGKVAALKGHLERMRSLERGKILRDWMKSRGQTLPDERAAEDAKAFPAFTRRLRFYRLEAESWLSKGGVGANEKNSKN